MAAIKSRLHRIKHRADREDTVFDYREILIRFPERKYHFHAWYYICSQEFFQLHHYHHPAVDSNTWLSFRSMRKMQTFFMVEKTLHRGQWLVVRNGADGKNFPNHCRVCDNHQLMLGINAGNFFRKTKLCNAYPTPYFET